MEGERDRERWPRNMEKAVGKRHTLSKEVNAVEARNDPPVFLLPVL